MAREVELQLQRDAVTTIWKDGVFGLGSGMLESLMNALDQFDFAIMVLSPDDLIETRNERYASPRDNVIFELGLFMGRLGRTRTFIVHEMEARLKLPSDLAGVTLAPYRRRDNLSAALSPTCTPIIKAIRSLGFIEYRTQQQIRAVAKEQQEQKSVIDQHQEFFDIVKFSLSSFCYEALWHIECGPEYIYNNHDEYFRRRMWFLRNQGPTGRKHLLQLGPSVPLHSSGRLRRRPNGRTPRRGLPSPSCAEVCAPDSMLLHSV